jgi:hypothetical protein
LSKLLRNFSHEKSGIKFEYFKQNFKQKKESNQSPKWRKFAQSDHPEGEHIFPLRGRDKDSISSLGVKVRTKNALPYYNAGVVGEL